MPISAQTVLDDTLSPLSSSEVILMAAELARTELRQIVPLSHRSCLAFLISSHFIFHIEIKQRHCQHLKTFRSATRVLSYLALFQRPAGW
jgi:hypothetical protein